MKKLIILFVLVIGGCGSVSSPTEFPITVGCDGVCDQPGIQRAINEWNLSQEFEVFKFTESISPDVLIIYEFTGYAAYYSENDRTIRLNPGMEFGRWEVYAHELGHDLGFQHSECVDPCNIMCDPPSNMCKSENNLWFPLI